MTTVSIDYPDVEVVIQHGIKELEIRGMCRAEAQPLAELLKTNNTLTSLDIIGSKISDEGAEIIAEALKVNTTLTLLNLNNNNISDEGAKAIAGALEENTILTKLDIGFNDISAEGAETIAEALKENTTLTKLDIVGNEIFDEGEEAIMDEISKNKVIARIEQENKLTAAQIFLLMLYREQNLPVENRKFNLPMEMIFEVLSYVIALNIFKPSQRISPVSFFSTNKPLRLCDNDTFTTHRYAAIKKINKIEAVAKAKAKDIELQQEQQDITALCDETLKAFRLV